MAATLEAPGLKLVIETNPEGEVDSVLPVSWTISEELIESIIEMDYKSPHVVIMVSTVTRYDSGEFLDFDYDVKRVYYQPLTATPKQYVQFTRAGENIVTAFIADLSATSVKRAMAKIARTPNRASLPDEVRAAFEASVAAQTPENVHMRIRGYEAGTDFEADMRRDTSEYYDNERVRQIGATFTRVMVPNEFFAKEPPAWARDLVSMFYHDAKGVDECDFRRRFLISLGLSVPVQFYGLFARIGTLLYGLFMAMRGMQFSKLFALRPHDFARSFQYESSFWFRTKQGKLRRGPLYWLSPPMLLLYIVGITVTAAVVLLLGFIAVWAIGWLFPKEGTTMSLTSIIVNGVVTSLLFGGIIFLIWLNFNWKGRKLRKKIGAKISAWLPEPVERTQVAVAGVDTTPSKRSLELLAAARRTAGITSAESVKDNTVNLVFSKIKRGVCQPFSR